MKTQLTLIPDMTGAVFSPDRMYRYRLWRTWNDGVPPITFIMLNPSTADDVTNDPTVERCQRRALALGYGGLIVVNIFAFRATDPKRLYAADDPIGVENDYAIRWAVQESSMVVCGWGTHGRLRNRGPEVLGIIRRNGKVPCALKINQDGSPAHPLYIGYDVKPIPMGTRPAER